MEPVAVTTASCYHLVFIPFHCIMHVSIPFHPHLVFTSSCACLHSILTLVGLQPRGTNCLEYGTRGLYTTSTQEPGCGATRRKPDDNSDQISLSIFFYLKSANLNQPYNINLTQTEDTTYKGED